jgi:hypothetical protein
MNWFSYLSVIGVSMLKFVFGPVSGMALGLLWYETFLCTILGMMATVFGMTFLSNFFRRIEIRFFLKSKKKTPFNKRNRWAIKVRQRLGMWGVALLTPILFTPPIGAILALAFRYPKGEIFYKMLISALIWGLLMVYFFYYIKELWVA